MADSAAFKPAPARSDHIAVTARTNEPPASAQASRPGPAGGLLRPSQVPVPGETSRRTGSPSPVGGRGDHGLQRLRPSGAPAGPAPVPARPSAVPARPVQDVLRGPGQPLAAPLREEMQARLGADFSGVRVHTGDAARAAATEVGARACTSGNYVVIGDGGADKHILAHELTHVIQQRQGSVAGTDHGSGFKVSDPFDASEKAAEANAARAKKAASTSAGHEQGRSLEPATRAQLEPRFNFDLSKVRVHDDSQAHRSAAALNARAFTVGDRIFFGAAQYAPVSPEGQQLLAHELAHVTQQMGNATPSLGWPPNPGLEQHADDVASRIVRGGSLADAPRPTGTVGAVHFKLATGVETITAQQVLDALAAGPLGAGPEAMALLDRLLRLSDIALAQVLREVADRDPLEAPPSRPAVEVEGETALDTLLRAADGLSPGDRLRLLTGMRAARQPRRAPTASPKVTSSPPPPPQHHEPGPQQRAREEQTFQQQLAAGTQDAAWNVAHRTSWPQIRQLVDAERGDIDLDFLLGWIDQESGGVISTQHPGHPLDEVSLMQISREERADLGIDTAAMRQRLLTDLRTAVHEGLRLVRLEQQRLLSMTDVGLSVNSPAFWPFVRLMHEVGEPATMNWVRQMKTEFRSGNGVDPAAATWDAIKEHARIHHQAHFPLERLRNVDIMIARGGVIHRALDAAP